MFELVEVTKDKNGEQVVSARDLHEFLEVRSRYNDWIKNRIKKYDFIENEDFITLTKNLVNGGTETNCILKLNMAKELAMVENNPKGKMVRKYFISCEKILKNEILQTHEAKALELDATKIKLESCKDIIRRVKPYYNIMKTIFNGRELQSLGVVAKLLCTDEFAIGRTQLMAFLRDEKVLLKDNTASQRYVISGCFNVRYKSVIDGEGELIYKPVTLVTGKGFMFIKRLVDKKYNK